MQWNPWHGCEKYSEGCLNCYVYRTDALYGRDSREVAKTAEFAKLVRTRRDGTYLIPPGETVFTCFTSDFFLPQADCWRGEAWSMIRTRSDAGFFIVTKRVERIAVCLPEDWGEGYENVTICCTCENQKRADERLPLFLSLPIRHRQIICEPLLEKIDLSPYLTPDIECVIAGGESGPGVRECDYGWVLSLRGQCVSNHVPFTFKQTGANFVKDGKRYNIARRDQHRQAKKAHIDYLP